MGGRSSAQLDDLARAVADGVPRRVVVGRIAAFMAAFIVGDPELALGAKKRCPKGRRRCGDICCKPGYVCKTRKGKHHCICPKPHKVCGGRCINPKTDEHNCGRCGHRCAGGDTCVAGTCTPAQQQQQQQQPTDQQPPAPTCTDGIQNGNETDVDCGGPSCPKCAEGRHCATGGDCATGVCTGGICVASAPTCSADVCGAQHSCPACALGKSCSGGADCASGHCSGGVCVQCESAANCTAAAAGSCQQAVCTSGTCGFAADDTNVPASTTCATGTCSGGTPVVTFVVYGSPAGSTTCASSTTMSTPVCDGQGNVAQSQTNCSPYFCADNTCQSSCSDPSGCVAGDTCLNGQCVPRQCTTAAQCPVANGTGVCNQGICEVGSCSAGYADCDGKYATGCETNLNNSVQNCGTCGHPCGPVTNATAFCSSGTCGYVCNPGFMDCNGNPADGCEFSGTTCP
jgi:hypothetical protein